jgi:hypothetical protein
MHSAWAIWAMKRKGRRVEGAALSGKNARLEAPAEGSGERESEGKAYENRSFAAASWAKRFAPNYFAPFMCFRMVSGSFPLAIFIFAICWEYQTSEYPLAPCFRWSSRCAFRQLSYCA